MSDLAALLREGAAKHAAGDLAGAAACYRAVLRAAPKEPNAHNLLGVLARQQGDSQAALRHTEQALALAPDQPAFLANRGAALAEAGRLIEGISLLRAALDRRPEDAVALRNLGQAFAALGDAAAAIAPLERAAALAPQAPEPLLALAHARRELGDAEGARQAAAALAQGEGPLAEQARFLLAGLGAAPMPDRAPAGYVRDLFDQFAPRFDRSLAALDYQTPALIAEALIASGAAPARRLKVLDLGCGTDLSGLRLQPFARRLEGLDLSPRMLAEARKRGLYDALHEADLLDWLPGKAASFDLIVAADVLNYLGDLAPALAAMRAALAPGGRMAFSVEAGDGAPVTLGEGLRYRHNPAAIRALLGAGLRAERRATLRQEHGAPVAGAIFVAGL